MGLANSMIQGVRLVDKKNVVPMHGFKKGWSYDIQTFLSFVNNVENADREF